MLERGKLDRDGGVRGHRPTVAKEYLLRKVDAAAYLKGLRRTGR